jgi:hypothetical protein
MNIKKQSDMYKTLYKFSLIFLLGGLILSCSQEEPTPTENPFFKMENGFNLSFKAAGGTQYVNVMTNTDFTATSSSSSWCIPEIVGKGQSNLKITVAENTDPAERTAVITIASAGFESYTITVTQGFIPPPPPVPDGADKKIVDLLPDLYYAFHNATDFTAAVVGSSPLEFSEPASVVASASAPAGRNAVRITKDNHVKVISPSANGIKTYTMLYDVRVPALSLWYSLLQTSEGNSDDGDLFINKTGQIGVSGYTDAVIEADKWYRIVMVVDVQNGASVCKYYLDGKFLFANGSSSIPGRMGLGKHFWLFTDEDGEENDLDCAGFALWSQTMLTDAEIAMLGGAEEPQPANVDARITKGRPDMYYTFNEADFAAPHIGSLPLEFSIPESVTVTDGPSANRKAATITKDNHVKVTLPTENGVKSYTMVYDVRVPAINLWYSLLQTNEGNGDDGDLFINKEGKIGVSQYTDPVIEAGKWYRIAVVVDVQNGASVCKYYLNGQYLFDNGSSSIPDRMGLGKHFWLFTDEDGEENDLDCAAFALWTDTMLTDEEIAALGGL